MLSQSVMDRVARHTIRMQGERMELVTYHYKPTAAGTLVSYPGVPALVTQFSKDEMQAEPMLRNRRRLRIAVADLLVMPTRHDTIARPDATTWSIEDVGGGAGTPWWVCRAQQVG